MMSRRSRSALAFAALILACGPSPSRETNADGTGSTESDTDCAEELRGEAPFEVTEENFASLRSVRRVAGDLRVRDISAEDLEFLRCLERVEGDLRIGTNANLRTLEGLNRLEHVGGTLSIAENSRLLSLSGLEQLQHIGGNLSIAKNDALSSLSGLERLVSVGMGDGEGGGIISIYDNRSIDVIGGFDSLTFVSTLLISANASLVDLGFPALERVGLLEIGGCEEFDAPHSNNESFVDFRGLPSLRSIDSLVISAQHSLTSLAPLQELVDSGLVIGAIKCQFNINLPIEEIQQLAESAGAELRMYPGCAQSDCPCEEEIDQYLGPFCAYDLSCGNQGDEPCPCYGRQTPCPAVCGLPE